MPENGAQNGAFLVVLLGGHGGDDDRLRVDHLAHDTAGAVGRRHEDLRLRHGQRQRAVADHIGRNHSAGAR